MATSKTPFQATSSWCYNFARYEALPEILDMPEVASGTIVLLRDFTQRALDMYLTTEEQNLTYQQAKAEGEVKVKSAVKFFVAYMAAETGAMQNLGKGQFRKITAANTAQDEVDAAEAAAVDDAEPESVAEEEDFNGWIYAFTFPLLQREDAPYPIKIGKTINDVKSRVNDQCKSSAFEQPLVLGQWKVKRMSHVESAIHYVLKARGRWRETAPGHEWFDTTPAEVEEVVKFVVPTAHHA